jgi:hypothetical protein
MACVFSVGLLKLWLSREGFLQFLQPLLVWFEYIPAKVHVCTPQTHVNSTGKGAFGKILELDEVMKVELPDGK